MEQDILKFKSNINCGNCIKAVTPALNSMEEIETWHVDTENSDKILTIKGEGLDASKIKAVINSAGFDLELISR